MPENLKIDVNNDRTTLFMKKMIVNHYEFVIKQHVFIHQWMSDCCLTLSVVMVRTSYIRWDDDVRFILDQHAYMSIVLGWLRQQSAGRHVPPVGHGILIPM